MIKVNVLVNNIVWKKYLKNPNNFIDQKVELLNKKNKLYKKNILICSLLLSGTKVREMLSNGEELPPEFARKEVAEILMKYYQSL